MFFSQTDRFPPDNGDGIKRRLFVPKTELSGKGAPRIVDDWKVNKSKYTRPMPVVAHDAVEGLSMVRSQGPGVEPPTADKYYPNLNYIRPNPHYSRWSKVYTPRFRYPAEEKKEPISPTPPVSRTPTSFNKRLTMMSDCSAKGMMRRQSLASSVGHSRRSLSPGSRSLSPTDPFPFTSSISQPAESIILDDSSVVSGTTLQSFDSYLGKTSKGNSRFIKKIKQMTPVPPPCHPKCTKNDVRAGIAQLRKVLNSDLMEGSMWEISENKTDDPSQNEIDGGGQTTAAPQTDIKDNENNIMTKPSVDHIDRNPLVENSEINCIYEENIGPESDMCPQQADENSGRCIQASGDAGIVEGVPVGDQPVLDEKNESVGIENQEGLVVTALSLQISQVEKSEQAKQQLDSLTNMQPTVTTVYSNDFESAQPTYEDEFDEIFLSPFKPEDAMFTPESVKAEGNRMDTEDSDESPAGLAERLQVDKVRSGEVD